MTIVPPDSSEPRLPFGPRDEGDAWVLAPTGERFWGRFGAAGLLAHDPARGVLLQKRVGWSHFGGTWGIPGGALHKGESASCGALREAQEEAGVPDGAVEPFFVNVLDLGYWSYTTVVGRVREPFEPRITDAESTELAWVPVEEVAELPLHPGFADAWEGLREGLGRRPALLVDAANVVGSVPDGWWRDREGANARLRDALAAEGSVPAALLGLPGTLWHAPVTLVVEGVARGVASVPAVRLVAAPGEGDDTLVAEAVRLHEKGFEVTLVSSDRGLAARVSDVARVVGASALRYLLDRA